MFSKTVQQPDQYWTGQFSETSCIFSQKMKRQVCMFSQTEAQVPRSCLSVMCLTRSCNKINIPSISLLPCLPSTLSSLIIFIFFIQGFQYEIHNLRNICETLQFHPCEACNNLEERPLELIDTRFLYSPLAKQ